jgi:hypothetical protein
MNSEYRELMLNLSRPSACGETTCGQSTAISACGETTCGQSTAAWACGETTCGQSTAAWACGETTCGQSTAIHASRGPALADFKKELELALAT